MLVGMTATKTQKVKRTEDGETIEDKVVKEIKLAELGDAIADQTPRVTQKISDAQKHFDQLYQKHIKEAGYTLDFVASKDAGTPIYKITGINDELKTEEVADALGIFLARKHHPKLAKRIEDLREKLEKEDFDKEKEETYVSVEQELKSAREELAQLGFDWNGIKKYLGQKGLTEELKTQIKDSYGKQALAFEGLKYLNLIGDNHKPLVVDYLKEKHKPFVKYKLSDLSLDELKSVFAQTHSIGDMYKEPEKQDLLEREMHNQFSHLYRVNAAKPTLREPKEYKPSKAESKPKKKMVA